MGAVWAEPSASLPVRGKPWGTWLPHGAMERHPGEAEGGEMSGYYEGYMEGFTNGSENMSSELRAELDELRAELRAAVDALRQVHDALDDYIEWNGAVHVDCPDNDACDCVGKPTNDKVDAACILAESFLVAYDTIHPEGK